MISSDRMSSNAAVVALMCAATAATWGLASQAMAGPTFPDQSVQAPQLRAPERGSVTGSMAGFSLGVGDLPRGTFTLPGPFAVPSERGALLVDPLPRYSPEGGISEWGMGWQTSLTIERHRVAGDIGFDEDDEFISPWGRLRRGSDGWWYPSGLGQAVRAELRGDGTWRAVLPTGTQLTFGLPVATARGTYAWYLTRADGVLGERTELSYTLNASGRPYLDTVTYGAAGYEDAHRISLFYESIATPFVDFRGGEGFTRDARVTQVITESRDAQAGTYATRWSYDLEYHDSPLGPAYFLARVTRRFPSGSAEPAIEYFHDTGSETFDSATFEHLPALDGYLGDAGGGGLFPTKVAYTDIDGDGRSDLEHHASFTLVRQTDAGWVYEALDPTPPDAYSGCRPDPSNDNQPRRLVRMTPEASEPHVVYQRYHESEGGKTTVALCNRLGQVLHSELHDGNWANDDHTRIADLDRDHHPEFIRAIPGNYRVLHNMSDDSGYAFAPQEHVSISPAVDDHGYWVNDINGDGRVDLIARSDSELVVWHGRGDLLFGAEPSTPGGPRTGEVLRLWYDETTRLTDLGTYHMVFIDANKDGLADTVFSKNGRTWLFLNQGDRFLYHPVPALAGASTAMSDPIIGDLSGRGNDEIVRVAPGQAHALAVNRPSTGLLVAVDDGKGNRVEFTYDRAPAESGVGQRHSVLGRVTMHTSGDVPVSADYDYGGPVVHSEGRHLIGYAHADKLSNFLEEAVDFYHDDDISAVTLSSTARDPLRAPGLTRFSANTYSEETLAGVRFFRPLSATSGVRDDGGSDVSASVSYLAYERGICPIRVATSSPHGDLDSQTTLAGLASLDPILSVAMHCLSERSTLTGSHSDSALDFQWQQSVARNALGQVTDVWQHSGGDSLLVQNLGYDDLHRLATVSRPGRGTTTVDHDPATGLLAAVAGPDGVVRRIDAREPRTDAIRELTDDRGPGGVFIASYRFDDFERLGKHWASFGGSTETRPLQRFGYEFPTASPLGPEHDQPGVITVESLVGQTLDSYAVATVFTAADGSELGGASLTPQGWVVTPLAMSERNQLRSRSYRRAPLSAAVDPSELSYAELIASATELAVSEASGLGHTTQGESVIQSGVTQTLEHTLAIDSGLLVAHTIENGLYTTSAGRDADGVTLWTVDELGNQVSYAYDAAGRLLEVELADGTTQAVRYDGFGRIDSVEHPGVGSVFYTYHPTTGQLETVVHVDSVGTAERTVTMEHDAIGRVTAEIHTLAQNGEELRFAVGYDGDQGDGQAVASGQLGRRTAVSGAGFVRSEVYNPDGSLATARLVLDDWLRFDTALTYHANGEIDTSSQTVTRIADGVIIDDVAWTHHYDAAGRLSRRELDGVDFAIYAYDSEGRVDQVTLPGGEVLVLDYDPTTHRNSGYGQGSGFEHSGASWQFNARGLIERESLVVGASATVRDYQYDERGFLIDASDAKETSSYSYTDAGLPYTTSDMQGTRVVARGTASTLTIDGTTYTWDAMGRVITKGDVSLEYGPDGQLARARRGGDEWTYLYDETGQRLLELENGVHQAAFVGGAYATDRRVIRPVRIAGRLIGMLDNGAFQLLATDPRGTRLADIDGTARLPTPYGVRTTQPDLSEALAFIEKAYHPNLGVVRLGVRDYDPALSQFWTPDPLFLESIDKCAESPVECNLYGYGAGNPISFIDPSGLDAWDWIADAASSAEYHTIGWVGRNVSARTLNNLANFSAGVGDELLMGAGGFLRSAVGVDDAVASDSDAYRYGGYAATVATGPKGFVQKLGKRAIQRAGRRGAREAGRQAAGGGRKVFRQLSADDAESLASGGGITPKGTSKSVADHVAGKPTGHVSCSKTSGACERFSSGNGLAEIDVDKAVEGGARYIDHNNVVDAVRRSGNLRAVRDAKRAEEVLFRGTIPKEAVRIISE